MWATVMNKFPGNPILPGEHILCGSVCYCTVCPQKVKGTQTWNLSRYWLGWCIFCLQTCLKTCPVVCLPFTLWINSILNTISPLFGKVLYISVCGPGVSIGLTLPWLELSVTCLFSLLKVPPPKPPRRQGGWADDPVLAPTKWVLTSFLIKRDLGVE